MGKSATSTPAGTANVPPASMRPSENISIDVGIDDPQLVELALFRLQSFVEIDFELHPVVAVEHGCDTERFAVVEDRQLDLADRGGVAIDIVPMATATATDAATAARSRPAGRRRRR